MTAYLRSPLTAVWFLLTAVTLVSWWVGAGGHHGESGISFPVTIAVVAIVLIKTRFVFWYFMEVRTAPSWLRWSCDCWLAFVVVMLLALYSYSLQVGSASETAAGVTAHATREAYRSCRQRIAQRIPSVPSLRFVAESEALLRSASLWILAFVCRGFRPSFVASLLDSPPDLLPRVRSRAGDFYEVSRTRHTRSSHLD
jgi:cytochrome c oxidase subunit IV